MKVVKIFFSKILENEKIVRDLEKLKGDIWCMLSFNERIEVFENIIKEISEFYPELGRPNFKFMILDGTSKGEENDDGIFINANMVEYDNCYDILATCLHELRHFYQRSAWDYYEDKGLVHELFDSKEQLEEFNENLKSSALFLNFNYIECGPFSYNEYSLQPIEYDAEQFSSNFLNLFSKKFLKEKADIKSCASVILDFLKFKELQEGNVNNIVEFNKIYQYNYQDNVKENRIDFIKEKVVFDRYMALLERMDYISDFQLFSLLNSCFYKTYDANIKVRLLNTYLRNNDSSSFIEYVGDGYYFNGVLFNSEDFDIYKIMEPLFLQVAHDKVNKIVSKGVNEFKCGFEKEIRINMAIAENFIKEESNPLFYKLQPSVLFINGFVKNQYLNLISAIDTAYSSCNNYFSDFEKYIRKYDSTSIIKKVEILTGKKFNEIYESMINKMKYNLKKASR